MTAEAGTDKSPMWLQIEHKIHGIDAQGLTEGAVENTVQKIAKELDETGLNVTKNAGNMLLLRGAVNETVKAGKTFLGDFNAAVERLSLEDVVDTRAATSALIANVGEAWPKLKQSERKPDVLRIVERKKLDLLVAKAKELPEEHGIRLLIAEGVAPEVIIASLDVSQEAFDSVNAAVEAERAERERVRKLIKNAEGKSDEEKIKALINNDVADELIVEIGEYEVGVVDGVRKAMEAELAEKKRLAEEEAARKKAEAEGPPLDQIPPDEMLEYIESIREILEFSDKENEIRAMCEQSSIPKSLVDVTVSDPDKLDELEKNAEG